MNVHLLKRVSIYCCCFSNMEIKSAHKIMKYIKKFIDYALDFVLKILNLAKRYGEKNI